jgi:hypothetical protein
MGRSSCCDKCVSGPVHALVESFTECPPRRPWEPILPQSGAEKYYAIFIILFPFSIQCHRTRHLAELVQTTYILFTEAPVNGRFRRSYQLNIVVIKTSEVLKYFFSYIFLKMDRFLLNSNKICESENKEGHGQPVARCEEVQKLKIWQLFGLWFYVDRCYFQKCFCRITPSAAEYRTKRRTSMIN